MHEYALQPRNWHFSQTIRRSAIAFLLRALSLWAGHNQEIFLFSTSMQAQLACQLSAAQTFCKAYNRISLVP